MVEEGEIDTIIVAIGYASIDAKYRSESKLKSVIVIVTITCAYIDAVIDLDLADCIERCSCSTIAQTFQCTVIASADHTYTVIGVADSG